MKKIDKAAWLVSACMLAAAAAALFFLPDELAIQWNNSGISNTGPKWIVLLFPALAALCIILHANQTGKKEGAGDIPWYFAGILLLFAAEIVIICNGLGLIEITNADSRLVTRCAAIILGCLLVFFGNRLPKTARNYYVGVKAPWAFENDDVWTKTQRFAAKVWVIAGLLLVALSFAPGCIQSAAVFAAILAIVILPRIYSKRVFEAGQNPRGK